MAPTKKHRLGYMYLSSWIIKVYWTQNVLKKKKKSESHNNK